MKIIKCDIEKKFKGEKALADHRRDSPKHRGVAATGLTVLVDPRNPTTVGAQSAPFPPFITSRTDTSPTNLSSSSMASLATPSGHGHTGMATPAQEWRRPLRNGDARSCEPDAGEMEPPTK